MKLFENYRHRFNKKLANFNRIHSEVVDFKFYIRRLFLENQILHCKEQGITDHAYCDHEIIVSLTSFGKRVNDVCFTIESLMQQSRKANRIILWLDEDYDLTSLPASLELQQQRGLKILLTKDIRSYKKLIPALIAYPEAAIITVDDDILYEFDILDRIITSYLSDTTSIHACRIHSMSFDKQGNLKPYIEWNWRMANEENPARNFLTGCGGILYPPHSLAPQVIEQDIFTAICPTADDVWFTAMALFNGTQIKKVPTRNPKGEDYIENPTVQDVGLRNINVGENGCNDKQIKAVFSKYDIYKLIR